MLLAPSRPYQRFHLSSPRKVMVRLTFKEARSEINTNISIPQAVSIFAVRNHLRNRLRLQLLYPRQYAVSGAESNDYLWDAE